MPASSGTFVLGFLGKKCQHNIRKNWNLYLKEMNLNGFFDFYPTVTAADLELRLAEMFLHHRLGYVVEEQLGKKIMKLLDRISQAASKKGRVDTVVNERGVIVGHFFGGKDNKKTMERRLKLWLKKTK
ncbi:hypothetical protein A3A67_01700 [Candidatus Peribacteria bacterium RIFCSPLOWO2_01_FULL_51_18]|nr:MAG: hypothetical protein A3C52_03860 [Candidatus Peribacteria bacterium RIFCSPHIGHO2_02_FULL_51_15]OGJ65181.1 MAG: hypothetical protein A3A67_01700 [Candidatus Peribacteria bacterium RIFCSPLOWO2_01_FULL_51_18]OGJ67249.1 MAG: hypothetical protein A3J34_00940 [Candidatus Peribacteria bacterium RIFCSPLOWO2_02_FULL_51_10]